MQDVEYSAYLKNQSYDDLLSISCSIDKEGQATRYEMVLAEIAEREKRGEKTVTKWHGHATLSLGVLFLLQFVIDLIWPSAGWKPIVHLVLGIVCLVAAWSIRKKENNEKPAA